MKVSNEEKFAIENFVLNVTIPIFSEIEQVSILLATGNLFDIGGRIFIITARHIFDKISDLSSLAYPEHPRSGKLYTFGQIVIYRPQDKKVDVAVIELKSKETIARLKKSWKFLSLNNIRAASSREQDEIFFLSGYPTALISQNNNQIKGNLSTAYTQRILNPPSEAKDFVEGVDLFFDYNREAISISGKVINTPELPGTSGASVWELRSLDNEIWTPENVVAIVGVQSSYIHNKYFRAKSWLVVAEVFNQIDSELAEAVRSKFFR
jgi:hypothetical protein